MLARDRDKTFSNFIAENGQKLAEAQRQADDWREKLVKAKLKSGRMSLTSPIDGTVYGLSVTTIGQVAGAGEELMRIVPEGAALEIECYLANKDVGFVKVGQKAVVKIESFPFTRYGTLSATVERVASDAIPEPDAQQTENRPVAPAQGPDLRRCAAHAKPGVSGDVDAGTHGHVGGRPAAFRSRPAWRWTSKSPPATVASSNICSRRWSRRRHGR